jgi:hypothetical protein
MLARYAAMLLACLVALVYGYVACFERIALYWTTKVLPQLVACCFCTTACTAERACANPPMTEHEGTLAATYKCQPVGRAQLSYASSATHHSASIPIQRQSRYKLAVRRASTWCQKEPRTLPS